METLKAFWKNKYYRPLRLALFSSFAFLVFLINIFRSWNDPSREILFFRIIMCIFWIVYAVKYWRDWLEQRKHTKEDA